MARRTTGNTVLPDDRSDKRSIQVPQELWDKVKEWGAKTDRSDSAIVRQCIQHAIDRQAYLLDMRGEASQLYRHVVSQWRAVEALMPKLDTVTDNAMKADLTAIFNGLEEAYFNTANAFLKLVDHKIFSDPVFGLEEYRDVGRKP